MALTMLFYLGLLALSQAEVLTLDLEHWNSTDDTLLGMYYKVVIQNIRANYPCTGAILNETHVITTVTCIFPLGTRFSPEALSIADSIIKPTFRHNVTEIIVHEKFSDYITLFNDIALLKVTPSIIPSDTIKFAKLPQADDVGDNDLALLLGWCTSWRRQYGCLTSFEISSYKITSQDDCRKYKHAHNESFDVLDTHFCAYSIDKDLIHSDSYVCDHHAGGLLTVNGTLVGLMSRYHNGNRNLPVLFTRVVSYLTWIK